MDFILFMSCAGRLFHKHFYFINEVTVPFLITPNCQMLTRCGAIRSFCQLLLKRQNY